MCVWEEKEAKAKNRFPPQTPPTKSGDFSVSISVKTFRRLCFKQNGRTDNIYARRVGSVLVILCFSMCVLPSPLAAILFDRFCVREQEEKEQASLIV